MKLPGIDTAGKNSSPSRADISEKLAKGSTILQAYTVLSASCSTRATPSFSGKRGIFLLLLSYGLSG